MSQCVPALVVCMKACEEKRAQGREEREDKKGDAERDRDRERERSDATFFFYHVQTLKQES